MLRNFHFGVNESDTLLLSNNCQLHLNAQVECICIEGISIQARPIREIISVITKQMISTSLKFRSTKNKNQWNCSVCISNTKKKTHAKNLRVHKVYHSNPLHTQRSKFSFLFQGISRFVSFWQLLSIPCLIIKMRKDSC